jgi:hypothetical protein
MVATDRMKAGAEMKARIILFVMILISAVLLAAGARDKQTQGSTCALIEQALTDYQRIKIGSTRGEVERYFIREEAAQFPSTTRYVYPKCSYLHLDVDFEAKAPPGHLFSPDDTVIKISKLYVDFLTKD